MHRSAVPFAVIGTLSVIVGGLVSAATAVSPSYTASWAVAYIVLVAGVVQLALGLGQAGLAPNPPSRRLVAVEAIAFNLANVAVLAGTLVGTPWIVDAGAGLILIALALFVWGVRGARTHDRWLLYGYRVVILVVLVTTPIGLIIAHVKAG